jgi:hypothetical protein
MTRQILDPVIAFGTPSTPSLDPYYHAHEGEEKSGKEALTF